LQLELAAVGQTIESIKKYNLGTKVLVGGRDAQYRPEMYLQKGADVVFLGQQKEFLEGCQGLLDNSLINCNGVATHKI